MQHRRFSLAPFTLLLALASPGASATDPVQAKSPIPKAGPDFEILSAKVGYLADLDLLVFEQKVAGRVGGTAPVARGKLDGAPVLAYVFPTTLAPDDVGFRAGEGIVALALTSHPDFDDSPLWDENNDRNYDNDGLVWHTHWVVLGPDARVPGGLSVKEISQSEAAQVLPRTAPPMPMLMDSPGYAVVIQGDTFKLLVPAQRVSHKKAFRYDAVSAYMEVSETPGTPILGVYQVYTVLSKDLSLPFSVQAVP